MTLPDHRASDLQEQRRKLATARKRLRALPHERDRALRAVTEDRELTDSQKEIATKRIKRDYNQKFEQYKRDANAALGSATELVREMRVNRVIDSGAQGRVRTLLERGLAISQVLERAVALKDADLIAALRAELLWWGDDRGFADAEESIRACDRALADVGAGNEARHNQVSVELAKLADPLPEIMKFAAKSVRDEAKPLDRLAMAHALRDAGVTDAHGEDRDDG